MAADAADDVPEPTREEVERLPGPVVLEFGTDWCGYCRAMAPQLAALLKEFPLVRHVQMEDGKGRPLGRSFGVKLWPTLVFLRDGRVLQQTARPNRAEIRAGLQAIALSP